MNKIALITDTASDLTEDIVNKYNVHVLPFRIIYGNKEFLDKVDITPKEVYDNLDIEMPTSSLPSMSDIENLFEKLESEGYTHAIAVTLSTGLSGIYNAVKLVAENHPNVNTYVCDSKSISPGEGIIIEECGRMIEEGKNFDEIVKAIPVIRSKTHVFFVVDTLEYLKRGGRIGKVAGTIAELLNIKPIIGIDHNDGKYYTHTKVRGRKQSLNKIIEILNEILKNKKCRFYVLHGNGLEDAIKVYNVVKQNINVTKATFGGNISPVAGVHSGPGLVGVALYEE